MITRETPLGTLTLLTPTQDIGQEGNGPHSAAQRAAAMRRHPSSQGRKRDG